MPPGEDPNKPKKRRDDQAEEVRAPDTDLQPTSAGAIEYAQQVRSAPLHIARYAADVVRGLAGEWWDGPHGIVAYGTSSSYVTQLFERRANGDARLIVSDLQEVATAVFMEAAAKKRALVCIISVSAADTASVDPRTGLLQQRELAEKASSLIAGDRLDHRDLVDGRDAVLHLLSQVSQPNFRPTCRWVADVAPARWTTKPLRARSEAGRSWFLVDPSDGLELVRNAMEALKAPGAELLLHLTSLPKECEPWLVGEKSQAERLHQALDNALTGMSMPASEEPLAEVSAPVDGVALARSVWQSLRAQMKEVIEARIRELSEQRFETFEEKAAVAAELHQAMMEWGYRAVSPRTGRAAYLRCHRQDKVNPNGCFQFRDIAGAVEVAQPDESAPMTSVRLPPFGLTDPPPDKRLTPSNP